MVLMLGTGSCKNSDSGATRTGSNNPSGDVADGKATAARKGLQTLPAGPSGRTVKDVGALSDLGIFPKRLSVAQVGDFIAVSSATLFEREGDSSSPARTEIWKLDTTTSEAVALPPVTGYAVGMATDNDHVLIAMSRCVGTADDERGCFATMSPRDPLVNVISIERPAGADRLFTSGSDGYVLSFTGRVASPALTLTKVALDGATNVAAWPTVALPAAAEASLDPITGAVTLTPTTSAVMRTDGKQFLIDWSSGRVTEAEAEGERDGESGTSLCGAGDNSVVVSFVDAPKGMDSDVQVRTIADTDGWNTVIQPDNGTNLGGDNFACAATKTAVWILISGQLYELDATDGHHIKRFDLRLEGAERGGGIDPILSITDKAVVAFSDGHLFTLS